MKCKNCGTENLEGSKFCKKCGSRLEEEIQINSNNVETEHVQPFVEPASSISSAKPKSKKIFAVMIIGILAVIGICAFLFIPRTINLNDYLVFEESGYNGYGSFKTYLDWDKLKSENKISFSLRAKKQYEYLRDNDRDPVESLKNYVYVSSENRDNLSNGDEASYYFTIDGETNDLFNCKLKYEDGTHEITNLVDAKKIDFFKGIENSLITISGRNGIAQAKFNQNLEDGIIIDQNNDFVVVLKNKKNSSTEKGIKIVKDNQEIASLDFKISKTKELSNGDEITVSLSDPLALIDMGYLPKKDHFTITVSNRPELISSMTREEASILEDYLNASFSNSSSYVYSNVDIHRVYFGKAKKSTITDKPYVVLIDYSYERSPIKKGWGISNKEFDCYAILYDIYKDNGELVVEKSSIDNSYGGYYSKYNDIDSLMMSMSNDYDFEMIWE